MNVHVLFLHRMFRSMITNSHQSNRSLIIGQKKLMTGLQKVRLQDNIIEIVHEAKI